MGLRYVYIIFLHKPVHKVKFNMNNFSINLLLSEIGENDDNDNIFNVIFLNVIQNTENNEVLHSLGLLNETLRDQIRNENYLMTIHNYLNDDFIQHFRMSRTVMQVNT